MYTLDNNVFMIYLLLMKRQILHHFIIFFRSIFVSDNNEAILRFHSDYSESGGGYLANWKAVDITGCPSQKLTAREGIISSPNYGEFLLPKLDCTTIIVSPREYKNQRKGILKNSKKNIYYEIPFY